MKYAKIVSVLAVFMMIFSCSACVLANENSESTTYGEGANALPDKDTVKLDPTKDYTANKTELEKLGLGEGGWSMTSTKTTLTLTDVVYTTAKNVALYIASDSDVSNIDLEIVIKGENSIWSGSTASGITTVFSSGISIYGDYKSITFSGDGSLDVGNDGISTTIGSAGLNIYAKTVGKEPPLTIKGCQIMAFGGDVLQDKETATSTEAFESHGLFANGDLTITDGAYVLGESGSVYSYSVPKVKFDVGTQNQLGVYAVMSNGVTTFGDLTVKNSTLIGNGGAIGSEYAVDMGSHTKVILKVISSGVFIGGGAEVSNATIYGYAGDSNGKDNSIETPGIDRKQAESVGIYYRDDFTATSGSSITGIGGKAYSNALSFSAGIGFFYAPSGGEKVKFTANDSYVYGEGGVAWATVPQEPFEKIKSRSMGFGGICETWKDTTENICFDVFLKNTVATFYGNEKTVESNGIHIIKWRYSEAMEVAIGSISIDNSELYATGHSKAIDVTAGQTNIIRVTGTLLFCAGSKTVYDPDYKPITNPDDLIKDENGILSCGLGFNYNAFLMSDTSEYADVETVTTKDKNYTLPECPFEPMEGFEFAGWLVNGEIYHPGDKFDLSEGPVNAYALWNVVKNGPSLTINSPIDKTKTDKDKIDVSGTTDGTIVSISVNGKDVGDITLDAQGKFTKTVSLEKGNNVIIVKAMNLGGETQKIINVNYEAGGSNNDVWMWVSIVLIIILIILVAAAGYFYYTKMR